MSLQSNLFMRVHRKKRSLCSKGGAWVASARSSALEANGSAKRRNFVEAKKKRKKKRKKSLHVLCFFLERTAGDEHDEKNEKNDADDDVSGNDAVDVVGVGQGRTGLRGDGALADAFGNVLAFRASAVARGALGV